MGPHSGNLGEGQQLLPPSRARSGPSPFSPLPGGAPTEVGGYRLLALIGSGGSGDVFLAESPSGSPLPRLVAVKVVHRHLCDDDTVRARLAREIMLARAVQGVGVVSILDADVDATAERPWLVTEYLPGPTLDRFVAHNGPLSPVQLRALATTLLEAIHSLHYRDVIHRDIKPANIIISPDGPRLIDLGIALESNGTRLTNTGGAVGTPSYMAPEVFEGDLPARPVDVFGWGCTMVFASTGRNPFGDDAPLVVMNRVMGESPDTSALPDDLRPLVEWALTKDPIERPSVDSLFARLGRGTPIGQFGDLAQHESQHLRSSPAPVHLGLVTGPDPEAVAQHRRGQRLIVGTMALVAIALIGLVAVSISAWQSQRGDNGPDVEVAGIGVSADEGATGEGDAGKGNDDDMPIRRRVTVQVADEMSVEASPAAVDSRSAEVVVTSQRCVNVSASLRPGGNIADTISCENSHRLRFTNLTPRDPLQSRPRAYLRDWPNAGGDGGVHHLRGQGTQSTRVGFHHGLRRYQRRNRSSFGRSVRHPRCPLGVGRRSGVGSRVGLWSALRP